MKSSCRRRSSSITPPRAPIYWPTRSSTSPARAGPSCAPHRSARCSGSCPGTSPTIRQRGSWHRICCWATPFCSSMPRICPQQALRLAELLDAAGAPDGVYQNVFATTDQVATMIASPLLQGVSLTGSERAGSAVGELAGRHIKKAVLELGGSDPFIVLPGADIDNAVSAAVAGRFGNAGQVCTSSKRMIVESSVFDEFLHGFVAKAGEWRLGDPTSAGHPAGTDGLAGGPHRSRRSGRGRRRQGRHRFTSAARFPTGPGPSTRRRCSPASRRRCAPSTRSCSDR